MMLERMKMILPETNGTMKTMSYERDIRERTYVMDVRDEHMR